MLGTIGSQGWQATMTTAAPTDGELFLAFLREVLCPTLRPGQIVVMDNLSAHKVLGVAVAITATGADLHSTSLELHDLKQNLTTKLEAFSHGALLHDNCTFLCLEVRK